MINHEIYTDRDDALKAIAFSHLRNPARGAEPYEEALLSRNFVLAHDAGASREEILGAVKTFLELSGGVFAFSRHARNDHAAKTLTAVMNAASLMKNKHPNMADLANDLTALSKVGLDAALKQQFPAKTPVEIALLRLEGSCKICHKKLMGLLKPSPSEPENLP